jgi:hypothetical protein
MEAAVSSQSGGPKAALIEIVDEVLRPIQPQVVSFFRAPVGSSSFPERNDPPG